jgi:hypothetical protein
MYHVSNGQEAIQFLARIGIYKLARRSEIIVVDLNLSVIAGLDCSLETAGKR